MQKARVYYFDVLRVAATMAVVFLHLFARFWEKEAVDGALWNDLNWLDSAVRWAVPVFVMLSGALFLNPAKEISFTVICKKNLLRIATAFGFWSVIYGVVDLWRGMPLKELPLTLLKGEYHMWFLFLIAGLYLFVPLLKKLTRTKKRTQWFLILFGTLFILIPRVVNLLTLLGVSVPFGGLILQAMNINIVSICYFFVFVLGYYLHQYELPKLARGVVYALGVLGFFATALLTAWHSQKVGAPSGMFYVYMSLNVLAMAVAVFVFVKYHPWKQHDFVVSLSRYSFGIYLSHILVMDCFSALCSDSSVLLLFGIPVFMVAFGLSFVLHRIPKLKDYVV